MYCNVVSKARISERKWNSFLGHEGLFLCWFIITLCIYTKIYILTWTDNKTNKEVALNMRFPKVFKMLMVFSYLYIGGLVYIYISADDFTTIMSSYHFLECGPDISIIYVNYYPKKIFSTLS